MSWVEASLPPHFSFGVKVYILSVRVKYMIAIIDYGMGNLHSVQKALEFIGCEAMITDDPAVLDQAAKAILPGVGAFADAIAELEARGLSKAVLDFASSGRPLLGICLGMQLLFESSGEGGAHGGLGVIPSSIVHFPADIGLKVPHMGWNNLAMSDACPLFRGIEDQPYVYFVHSFHAPEISPEWTAATSDYGKTFTAAVQVGNVFGTQFHPEKSGAVGLAMLRNFASL